MVQEGWVTSRREWILTSLSVTFAALRTTSTALSLPSVGVDIPEWVVFRPVAEPHVSELPQVNDELPLDLSFSYSNDSVDPSNLLISHSMDISVRSKDNEVHINTITDLIAASCTLNNEIHFVTTLEYCLLEFTLTQKVWCGPHH